jgi:hypothetical protein
MLLTKTFAFCIYVQHIIFRLPQAAARLREFAMVRAMAMEMQTASHNSGMEAAAAEAARAVRCGESGNPCKLQIRISQVDYVILALYLCYWVIVEHI